MKNWKMNLLVVLVLSVGAYAASAEGQAVVRKTATKASVLFAQTDSKHVKSVSVRDHKYAPDCSTKLLSVPLTLAGDCDICGPKEACIEFKAPCDCDAVESVKQRKHYTEVKLKSGRKVEIRHDKKGNVEVDYDRD